MSKQRDRKRPSQSRPRGTPRWLTDEDLDAMARRRCLMVLSVLSGEKTVSDVIAEEKIARQTYYQIEERGLRAMLSALLPAMTEEGAPTSAAQQVALLQKKVTMLEQAKRRLERLLLLTRKVVKPGRVVLSIGRPPKRRSTRRSGRSGSKSSPASKTTTSTAAPARTSSTPTTDGGAGR